MLSLKENQPSLYEDCAELFTWLKGPHALDEEIVLGADKQVDGGHGRVETRQVWCTSALDGVASCERWPGLTSLVMVESTRHVGGQDEMEQRYYISSLPGATDADAKRLNGVIRTHWEIENRVHWVLDVAMAEVTNRTRKGESAQNLALIRKLALNLLRRETSVKTGFAAKQKRAGWDRSYLLKSWHKLDAIALGVAYGQEDTEPPVILEFTIAPVAFDTSLADVVLDYCVTAADLTTGLGGDFLDNRVTATAPGVGQLFTTTFAFISGANEDTQCRSVTIPRFSILGTFYIQVTVRDRFNTAATYRHPMIGVPADPNLCAVGPCELQNIEASSLPDSDAKHHTTVLRQFMVRYRYSFVTN